MSNISQQTISLDDLAIETITLDTNMNSYTITLPSDLYTSTSYINTNMNVSGAVGSGYLSSDTITITGGSDFIWNTSQEWINSFPEWSRVEDMCKHYPGLEIALRNFKTIYTLVKDDYDNPKTED